jgi:uncharacterized protein
MLIQEKVEQLWKESMKARSPTKDTLSLIKTELKNKWIAERQGLNNSVGIVGLPDDMSLAVLSRMAKQRRESIEEYNKAGRTDLSDKENAELDVINSFLPTQLSDDDIKEIINSAVAEAGVKDFVKVMKIVMPKIKGKADGKKVQNKIKEILE